MSNFNLYNTNFKKIYKKNLIKKIVIYRPILYSYSINKFLI